MAYGFGIIGNWFSLGMVVVLVLLILAGWWVTTDAPSIGDDE